MKRIWIWPDVPDRDPPVRLFDGSAADWLRWGSTVKGENNGTKQARNCRCAAKRWRTTGRGMEGALIVQGRDDRAFYMHSK